MEILSEMSTETGSKWLLVKFSNTFYGYGTVADFNDIWGLPVNQCGSKEEVLKNCIFMRSVCEEYIEKYKKIITEKRLNNEYWKMALMNEQTELKMLIKFAKVLREL